MNQREFYKYNSDVLHSNNSNVVMEECSSNRKRKIERNDKQAEEVILYKLWQEVFTTKELPQSQYLI